MTTKVIERLVAELGFDIDSTKLQKFQAGLVNVKSAMQKAGAVAAAFTVALFGVTKLSADNAGQLDKTAKRLNTTIDAYQNLSRAAKIAGESQESLTSTLDALMKKSQDVRFGDAGAIRGFSLLGIQLRDINGQLKTSDKLLLDVADRIKIIRDPSIRRKALSELGISEEFAMNFLMQGSAGIKEFEQRSSAIRFNFDEDTIKSFREFNVETRLLWDGIKGIKDEFAKNLLPIFKEGIKTINDWFAANRGWLSLKIERAAHVISSAFKTLINLFKTAKFIVTEFVNALKQFWYALVFLRGPGIKLVGAALRVAFAANPIGAAITAALLLFSILEDIYYYFTGEKDTLTAFLVDKIKSFIKNLPQTLKSIFSTLSKMILENIVTPIIELFHDIPKLIKEGVKEITPDFIKGFVGISPTQVTGGANPVGPAVGQTTIVNVNQDFDLVIGDTDSGVIPFYKKVGEDIARDTANRTAYEVGRTIKAR